MTKTLIQVKDNIQKNKCGNSKFFISNCRQVLENCTSNSYQGKVKSQNHI